MNSELDSGVKGGQGREPDELRQDAVAFAVMILAALILVCLAGCNSFSRLYGA